MPGRLDPQIARAGRKTRCHRLAPFDEAVEDSLILSDLAMLPNALDKKALKEFVDVKSEYFALYSTVKVGEITRVNKSLLRRAQSMGAGAQGSDPITVIRRTDGDF